jgi:hypothetical protein
MVALRQGPYFLEAPSMSLGLLICIGIPVLVATSLVWAALLMARQTDDSAPTPTSTD